MKFRDKSLIGVCPAGRERSYGGMPKAGRCPKYYFFFDICKEMQGKKIKNASFGYLCTCPKSSNFAASNDAAFLYRTI